MRLHFETPEVETTEPLASQQMGIREQDMHIVLDLLRNKLYRDPIKACVREYLCNARDAHRETGTPDKPVRVILPTEMSRQIEIKDEGPGISPRRMGDIFLNYGASTKRRDNSQQGCFGLGSKSGLSISNQLSVVSTYNGVKRHYRVYIDETKIGRCDLVNEEQTTEHSGTTIILPVKAGDEHKFANAVVQATRHWKVRPDVLNMPAAVTFPNDPEPVLSEPDSWSLAALENVPYGYNADKVLAIVDGIPYPVTAEDMSFNRGTDDWKMNLMNKRLNMYFNTGEISLVPSRDSILFDERTIKTINRRLEKVRGAVFENALTKLAAQTTLLDAEIFWDQFATLMPGTIKKDFKPEWNGITLSGLVISRKDSEPLFSARSYSMRRPKRNSNADLVISSDQVERVHLGQNVRIFWNDTDATRGFSRRIEQYIRNEGGEKKVTVCLISFPDTASQLYWLSNRHLLKLGALPVSTIPAIPRAARGSRPQIGKKKETVNCWRFSESYRGEKDSDRYWEPVDMDKDVDEECVYIQSVNKSQGEIEAGDFPSAMLPIHGYSAVREAELILKVLYPDSYKTQTLYLVPRRLEGQLGPNWKRLDRVFPSRVANVFKKIVPAEIKRATEAECHVASAALDGHVLRTLKTAVENGTISGLVASFIKESKVAKAEFEQLNELAEIANQFSRRYGPKDGAAVQLAQQTLPEHPIILRHMQVQERYPLLFRCASYVTEQELAEYIGVMDSYHNSKQQQNQVVASAQIDDEPDNYCVAV